MTFLLKFFPGLAPYVAIIKLVVMLAVATALVGTGMYLESMIKESEIAGLKMEALQARANSAETALADLNAAAAKIKDAADQFNALDSSLITRMDTIRKDLRNAKPLPIDCRPDAFRVRRLADAIGATNQAIAGQLVSQDLPAGATAGR